MQPGIFYYGVNTLAGAPFGEGKRCAGGTTVRTPPVQSNAAGTWQRVIDNTAPMIAGSFAPIVNGATLHFQFWYRDPNCTGATSMVPGDCNNDGAGSGFNLSDGYSISFGP